MFSLRNTTQELNDSRSYVDVSLNVVLNIYPHVAGHYSLLLVLGTQATQKAFSHLEVPLFTGLKALRAVPEFAVLEVWTNPPNFLF